MHGSGAEWPVQWAAGRRKPPSFRTGKIPLRLSLVCEGAPGNGHLRWTPRPDRVHA
jgi:anthraniloyl-CoA monooxygenase